jgi:hypothetical protein
MTDRFHFMTDEIHFMTDPTYIVMVVAALNPLAE